MPAAAVIPAPVAYVKVAAVKTLVAESRADCFAGVWLGGWLSGCLFNHSKASARRPFIFWKRESLSFTRRDLCSGLLL